MLMLLAYVGNDRYTINYRPIEGIFPRVSLQQFVNSPPFVIGVMLYEGLPIPILDLAYLADSRYSHDSFHSRIILLTHVNTAGNKQLMGLLAERVTETIDLDEADFKKNRMMMKNLFFVDSVLTDNQGIIQNIQVEDLFQSLANLFSNL